MDISNQRFSAKIPDFNNPTTHNTQPSDTEKGFISQLGASFNQVNNANMVVLSQQNQDKILEILHNLPEDRIRTYLEQAFPKQDLAGINDKKKFAERLIDEINQNIDESNTLVGKVLISTNKTMPTQSSAFHAVHPRQHIFAHFDTFGRVPPNTQVFVKWINLDTQEIVLFTPKYIVENSQQNWVSAVPTNGWKAGKYDVKFYQMTDSLTPIAQSSYTIQSVLK